MKKISLFSIIFILYTVSAISQQKGMRIDTLARLRTNILKVELSLDSTQMKQVYKLEKERLLMTDSIRRNGGGIITADRKQIVIKSMENYSNAMRKILSNKQWKAYVIADTKRSKRAQADKAKLKSKVTTL
jgi:hypothetical protein